MRRLLTLFVMATAFALPASAQVTGDTLFIRANTITPPVYFTPNHSLVKLGEFKKGDFVLYRERLSDRILIVSYKGQTVGARAEDVMSALEIRKEKYLREQEARREKEMAERMKKDLAKGVPIYLLHFDFDINSAGGVEPEFSVFNLGSERIKYLYVTVTPYNAVGDPVPDEHRGRTSHQLKCIGPIDGGSSASYTWSEDPPFYAETTQCIEVKTVRIEYMNGKSKTITNTKTLRYSEEFFRAPGECKVN